MNLYEYKKQAMLLLYPFCPLTGHKVNNSNFINKSIQLDHCLTTRRSGYGVTEWRDKYDIFMESAMNLRPISDRANVLGERLVQVNWDRWERYNIDIFTEIIQMDKFEDLRLSKPLFRKDISRMNELSISFFQTLIDAGIIGEIPDWHFCSEVYKERCKGWKNDCK